MLDGTLQHEGISTLLGRSSGIYEKERHDERHSELVEYRGRDSNPRSIQQALYRRSPLPLGYHGVR